jgi:heme/copper-type cytochrome/quinol oxidase subunit 3
MAQIQRHPYHLVDQSPWPLTASLGCLSLTTGGVMYMHGYSGGVLTLTVGFLCILGTMYVWWRDITREAVFQGHHTKPVQAGLRFGMLLFITSEVMFFLAFFWAFFHSALSPVHDIGCVWPPVGIDALVAWEVPALNTAILLLSGASVTWAHHAIIAGKLGECTSGLIMTVALGAFFTCVQGYEYVDCSFQISDGIFGSTFFVATGFHGLHVLIGTTFLVVCLFRAYARHFSREHHFGFEAAAWYWHFVDVVWLFLFVCIYWWGGR